MDAINELLARAVGEIYPSREALEKVLRSGKKLRLYQGFDPSGIQLHIGHMTGLMKLRAFQKLGHHVIFLIGDGTGQSGDPSGKTRTREKFLTREELRKNAKDYVMQAGKIVDFKGENPIEILYNGDWLNKLGLVEILNIARHFSLQQLEERDMFIERKQRGEEINMREFLYPLLQGYDSVAMNVDLELGGTDQTFNMLAGRKLVREMQGREKFVMTTPLLTDSTGKKIGKTEGNVIALTSAPRDLYGIIMTLSDDSIVKCFEYITDLPMSEVNEMRKKIEMGDNPMIYKKRLAFTLIRMLNDQKSAEKAERFFETTFQKRKIAADLNEAWISNKRIKIIDLLTELQLVKSNSEARRLVKEGAVDLGDKRIISIEEVYDIVDKTVLKVGKHRIVRLRTQ